MPLCLGAWLRSILELGAEIHTSTATVDSFGVPPAPGEIFHWAMSLSKDGDYAVYINGDGVATGSLSEDDMRAIVDEYMAFPWTLGGRFGRYLGQYVPFNKLVSVGFSVRPKKV